MKKEILEIDSVGSVVVTTNKRAKNIRLYVSSGKIRVTKPYLVPQSAVRVFLSKNEEWIQKKLESSKRTSLINDGDVLAPGTKVVIRAADSALETTVKTTTKGLVVTHSPHVEPNSKHVQEEIIRALAPVWRKHAKKYLPDRLDTLADTYGFKYNKLRLKNIHSRWGSCSSAKNINLNIQLMKLDEDLIDHVLLHELSHTKAMNHGADFWEVFEAVRTGARAERKQLKQMVIF